MMYKLKQMILMLCLILSGALCYANVEARTENRKGDGHQLHVEYGRPFNSTPPND